MKLFLILCLLVVSIFSANAQEVSVSQPYGNAIRDLNLIDLFIIVCIILFLLTTIGFIIVILVSRFKKNRGIGFKNVNTEHINKTLFAICFDGSTLEIFRKDPEFNKHWKEDFYKQQFLTELMKLHRLYGGEIALNLRRCYVEFRLIQLSYAKMRSRRWEIKCAGIQELSEMEIKKAVPIILEHTKSKNGTLKMVALIEVTHLKGLEGLTLLNDYQEPLNDWIQLNLLESIKEENISSVPDFGYLLNNKNESIVVFGLRLIQLFHQNQNRTAVKDLRNFSTRKVQIEAEKTYNQLVTYSG